MVRNFERRRKKAEHRDLARTYLKQICEEIARTDDLRKVPIIDIMRYAETEWELKPECLDLILAVYVEWVEKVTKDG